MRTRCVAFVALLALAFAPAPLRSADDQAKTPTVIVRVQSLDGLIADARYLATLAGQGELATQAEGVLKTYIGEKGIEGIDTKRPMGVYGFLTERIHNSEAV